LLAEWTTRLQQALLLEIQGDYAAAEAAARAATDREETNFRNWLVLSRIAAERGHAQTAVSAYEEARSLNPHAAIFQR
jgi:cytochrome c-type biogenesis protein CcmH/NrfG